VSRPTRPADALHAEAAHAEWREGGRCLGWLVPLTDLAEKPEVQVLFHCAAPPAWPSHACYGPPSDGVLLGVLPNGDLTVGGEGNNKPVIVARLSDAAHERLRSHYDGSPRGSAKRRKIAAAPAPTVAPSCPTRATFRRVLPGGCALRVERPDGVRVTHEDPREVQLYAYARRWLPLADRHAREANSPLEVTYLDEAGQSHPSARAADEAAGVARAAAKKKRKPGVRAARRRHSRDGAVHCALCAPLPCKLAREAQKDPSCRRCRQPRSSHPNVVRNLCCPTGGGTFL